MTGPGSTLVVVLALGAMLAVLAPYAIVGAAIVWILRPAIIVGLVAFVAFGSAPTLVVVLATGLVLRAAYRRWQDRAY